MAQFLGSPKVQYFDSGTADFLEGGKLYTYDAGTTNPRATYPTIADALAGTNANTNPIILDARGEATVVISGATKVVLKDADDNTIWTVDNVDSNQDIVDGNGNEIIKLVGVASAVNEITVTNAATGNPPIISATGSNTNVGLKVTSKGSGSLFLDGGSTGTVEIGTTSTGQINLRRATVATSTLTANGTTSLTGTTNISGNMAISSASINVSSDTAINIFPAGVIMPYAGTSGTPPDGWLFCNGGAISRTTYSTLFNALGSGTAWGIGDGSTTFNLPDFRGYTLVGAGGTSDATLGNAVGNAGGSRTHTLTTAEMPAHSHTYNAPGSTTAVTGGGVPTPFTTTTATATTSAGSGNAHNNIQPSKIIQWIIKVY